MVPPLLQTFDKNDNDTLTPTHNDIVITKSPTTTTPRLSDNVVLSAENSLSKVKLGFALSSWAVERSTAGSGARKSLMAPWWKPPLAPSSTLTDEDQWSWSTSFNDSSSESWTLSDDDDTTDSSTDDDDTSSGSSEKYDLSNDSLITPQLKRYCHPPQHLIYLSPQEWKDDSDSDGDHDDDDTDESSLCLAHGEKEFDSGEEKELDSQEDDSEDKQFDSQENGDDSNIEQAAFESSSSSLTRVSFSSDEPQVHIVPRTSLEDMNDLYYSCHELQKFHDQRALEDQDEEQQTHNLQGKKQEVAEVGELC